MTEAEAKPNLTELRARYLAAQLRGDRREALRVVMREGLDRGASLLELSETIIGGAQREIGEMWERNELGIADEHMATAVSSFVLAHLYERSEPLPSNGRRVYVACVEGELHELPARMVADALDMASFDVRYLGPDVPTRSLLAMLSMRPPDLVALSATTSFHAPVVRDAVERIRVANPILPIAIGGGACSWATSLPYELGVHTAPTARACVDLTKRLLGVTP